MNDNDMDRRLIEISGYLKEISVILRIINFPLLKNTFETILDSEDKKLVYQLFDGNLSVKEIEKLSGVNVRYISEWGQKWEDLGLLEQSTIAIKGRRRKTFDLTKLNISIQKLPKTTEAQ